MNRVFRNMLLASALILPAYAGPAIAQDAQTSKAHSSEGLETVVVTAQKRPENAQKAAALITVISPDAIAARGLTTLMSMESLVPSARFAVQSNEAQIFIRGIGSQVGDPQIPEDVSTHLNGIVVPRYATGEVRYDLSQVEVLPGPQGTLYGRSAVGGVINMTTRRPGNKLGLDLSADYGNYNAARVTAAGDLPVSDTVSLRGAALYARHDGYNNNGTYNQDVKAGRLSFLAKPDSRLTVYLWGSYYWSRAKPSPLQYVPYGAGGPWYFPPTDTGSAFAYPPNGLSNKYGFSRYHSWKLGGQIDYDLGNVTITYIPGYLAATDRTDRSIAGFKQNAYIWYKQFSNEIRVSNNDDKDLKWLVGVSQFHQTSRMDYVFGPNFGGANTLIHKNAYAIYGQATYSVLDHLRLVAGARYSWDKLETNNAQAIYPVLPYFTRGILTYNYSESWARFNWKLGVEADVGPESMLYANVQTGFAPGTYQVTAPVQGGKIAPQKMIGVTAGSKNRFLDDRLQANLELFYYRYRDQIVQAYDVSAGAADLFNAPHSRMYGGQLETIYALADNTQVNLSVSYLNAKISKFTNGTENLAGFTLPYAPEWTVSAGLQQIFPLASGAWLQFRVDTYYNGGYWETFEHQPDLRQGAFTKTDVSLSYNPPNGRYEISVWGRNLENSAVQAAAGTTGRPYPYAGAVYVEPPRTYGVTLHIKM